MNLKIGQFSFSEQDLAIPVNGIPLTVVRTYNSLHTGHPRPSDGRGAGGEGSDFGPGWTFAFNSLDVQLAETRESFTVGAPDNRALVADVEEDENGLPLNVSIRTGGSRDVTLTLPDGRRTTFAFNPWFSTISLRGHARWTPPSDVQYTLTPLDSEFIDLFPLHWFAGGEDSTFENHDVKGWVLEAIDKTQYFITRGTANNVIWDLTGEGDFIPVKAYDVQPKLTRIEQRSGDVIEINDNGIFHKAGGTDLTRSVWIERGDGGRIVAIRDTNSGSNGLPVVKYIYNHDTGNLIQVHRLQDRVAGNYLVTKYHYDHPTFPHYITSIEDPRGIPVARNLYDDAGRLVGVIDSSGRTNRFEHDISRRRECHFALQNHPPFCT